MTSAPRSASMSVPNGPAPYCSTATMRSPASGPGRPRASSGGAASDVTCRVSGGRDAPVDGVTVHVRGVERDAEPGALGQVQPSVAEEARDVGELPEERVALLVEALDERVARCGRQQVRGD